MRPIKAYINLSALTFNLQVVKKVKPPRWEPPQTIPRSGVQKRGHAGGWLCSFAHFLLAVLFD